MSQPGRERFNRTFSAAAGTDGTTRMGFGDKLGPLDPRRRAMRQRILSALALFLLAAPAAQAATVQVDAFNFAFSPAEVNINVGDTVIWTGLAGGHNVVADDGSFDSGSAGTFQHTFNSAGSFPYV